MTENEQIGIRIKERRKELKLTQSQVADKVGVTKSTIQRYENGLIQELKTPVLHSIANALSISIDYITLKSDSKTYENKIDGVQIPVLGYVAAGIPIDAIEYVVDYEEIPLKMARTGEFFGLQVKGDSMSPRIQEGDVLIVKQQDDAETGDIVIAQINGDSACVKRLLKQDEGIVLQSFNPTYAPMYFSNKDIIEKPVRIIGKVIENRQKF